MQRSSTNRFRPFVQIGQGMLPGSLSGSETDVSTSNENLSTATEDERYYAMMIIGRQQRQEPQGQEGGNLNDTADQSATRRDGSNRSSLDVSSSSYNTLIIHSAGEEPWAGRGSGPRDSSSQHQHSPTDAPHERLEITDIPDDYLSQSSVLKHLAKEVKVTDEEDAPQQRSTPSSSSRKRSPTLRARALGSGGDKYEKVNISKSQPDLSTIGIGKSETGFRRGVSAPRPPTRGREEEGLGVGGSGGRGRREDEVWPTAEMVEILIKENSALKHELENCYRRVERTQRLEQEILKVHRGHEELVQSCERRERLERAARARLQSDCRRLQELNRVLREQCEALASAQTQADNQSTGSGDTGPLRRELGKREGLIKQLIVHNKELSAAKERQEIELAAQRATLQEQRTHIDILDTALTNAQANVVRLEDECRKKQVYVERVAQLQRALSSLQLASDRREQTERKLRSQLERELQLRAGGGGGGGVDSGGSDESASELKRLLREKEERIMMLEGECSKWEQRFLEESALRQAAIDAASIPKDAKIAALEKTSQETERIIAEARNEKIRHMDEVHAAQRKVADLESRVKDLESKLAEKDAMIRVLQKHTYDKDVSSMLTRSPHHTPHPSLSGTTGTTDIDHVLATREELVSSVLTTSTTYGCSSSSGDSSSYRSRSCVTGATVLPSYGGTSDYSEAKQSLDDQLKEIDNRLDTQLLSKRGLCCFPGFANQVAAQREGDTPGTLLARLRRDANGKGAPFSRNESAMLEKQGRASQRQRAAAPPPVRASAAPSSLPRPPARRSGLPTRKRDSPARSLIPGPASAAAAAATASASPRRFGEYGRLSESAGSSAASLMRRPASGRREGERDSASTLSDGSASSLPAPSKIKLYGSTRRGSSLGRDSKSSTDSTTSKYRIQF